MKVDVLNMQGEKVSTTDLPDAIFAAPILQDLMHQALIRQLANARLGTHKTKQRNEVSGGGRKPWRQKGTGRARHGSTRSPIWVGGGKVFTPQPRDYRLKMPRKMRRAALRSALSTVAEGKNLVVVDDISLDKPATQKLEAMLTKLGGAEGALILVGSRNENVEKSVRNLPKTKALRAQYVNVRDLLGSARVILAMEAVDVLQSFLGSPEPTEPVKTASAAGAAGTSEGSKSASAKAADKDTA